MIKDLSTLATQLFKVLDDSGAGSTAIKIGKKGKLPDCFIFASKQTPKENQEILDAIALVESKWEKPPSEPLSIEIPEPEIPTPAIHPSLQCGEDGDRINSGYCIKSILAFAADGNHIQVKAWGLLAATMLGSCEDDRECLEEPTAGSLPQGLMSEIIEELEGDTARLDSEGRDATSLPGLWSEGDRPIGVSLLEGVTRLEVIEAGNGRRYTNWNDGNRIRLSFQDEGRTLKVFVDKAAGDRP